MKKLLVVGIALGALMAPAVAADMKVKAPILAPPPFTWTGWYVGGNLGGKSATSADKVSYAPSVIAGLPNGTTLDLNAINAPTNLGGGQVGYNYQIGQAVLGVEGDIDAQHWNVTQTLAVFPAGFGTLFVPGDAFSVDSKWQASVRGRLGYAWDRAMLYATGGAAFTKVSVASLFVAFGPDPATAGSSSQTLVGATIGGGFEFAFWQKVSFGLEGRYTWYGTHTFATGTVALGGGLVPLVFVPVTQAVNLNTSEALAKLNYHF
jgi:outer membrane immunogenic protein